MGVFSEESLRHFIPILGGQRQTPVTIRTLAANSTYWKATELQTNELLLFLVKASYPHKLRNAPGGKAYLAADANTERRGKIVFAENCAACHSSKVPKPSPIDATPCIGSGYLNCWERYWAWTQTDGFKQQMQQIVLADDFLDGNYLSNDMRVPVTLLQTNVCISLSTNALQGNIWDNFSSESYKQLPSVGTITVYDPFTGQPHSFQMPGGGRGYTRVPSLASIWSTAPFLLDNTLGTFAASPSVEARMKSFQDAASKLLWPEKRATDALLGRKVPGVIDRTTATSWLTIPGSYFPYFIRRSETVPAQGDLQVGPIPRGTPVNLLANIGLLPETDDPGRRLSNENLLAKLVHELNAVANNASDDEARTVLVNLAEPLLAQSKCPDLVVGRGHYFGSSLNDDDKLALIEFLKSF
jgi:hypothetical protein